MLGKSPMVKLRGVTGEPQEARQWVLEAHSPYFLALFKGNFGEVVQPIAVPLYEEELRHLINYMYHGGDNSSAYIFSLRLCWVAKNYYQMDDFLAWQFICTPGYTSISDTKYAAIGLREMVCNPSDNVRLRVMERVPSDEMPWYVRNLYYGLLGAMVELEPDNELLTEDGNLLTFLNEKKAELGKVLSETFEF